MCMRSTKGSVRRAGRSQSKRYRSRRSKLWLDAGQFLKHRPRCSNFHPLWLVAPQLLRIAEAVVHKVGSSSNSKLLAMEYCNNNNLNFWLMPITQESLEIFKGPLSNTKETTAPNNRYIQTSTPSSKPSNSTHLNSSTATQWTTVTTQIRSNKFPLAMRMRTVSATCSRGRRVSQCRIAATCGKQTLNRGPLLPNNNNSSSSNDCLILFDYINHFVILYSCLINKFSCSPLFSLNKII